MTAWQHLVCSCSALALLVASQTPCLADDRIDSARADDDRQHRDLLDQEKRLLQQNDELQRDVLDLKKAINEKVDKLESAQGKLDRVRHQLITVRMKLMP
jgi:predicted  nucleic acid-binding Zn-ribbon protein